MKFVKYLSFLFLGVLALTSCQKEYSIETGGAGGTIGTGQWEFKEGSRQFKGTMDTASIDTLSGIAYLTMKGTSDSSNQFISFTIFGTEIKAGTYVSPSVTFMYTDISTNIIYQNDASGAANFTLVITKIDTSGVTGTFSGTVKDAASADKTIASGKFSALFKKATTPPVTGTTNCKIEQILEYDSTGVSQAFATTFTYNASGKVTKGDFVQTFSGSSLATFNLTYSTNKIQIDANQYFVTDANGRITQFYGYQDPTSDTTDKIIATYTYNAAGQMTQRKQAYQAAPTVTIFTMDYTWTGNNLTKAVGKVPVSATASVTLFDATYQYDNSKTVKNFLYLNALAFEILYLQPSVNAGSTSTNALVKSTVHYYDTTGTVLSTYTCNLTKYIIDANNYVQSFVTSGDDFDEAYIYSGEKYAFKYKCF